MAGPTSPALCRYCTQVQRPSKFYHSKFGRPIQICDEAQGRSRKETPVEMLEENYERSGNIFSASITPVLGVYDKLENFIRLSI